MLRAAALAFIGALAAVVINRGLSAYHDGLRPLLPEFRRNELGHVELGKKAYDISIGFAVYYGVPFALVTGVMVSHVLFLGADVIGVRFRSPALAAFLGAAYGAIGTLVLDATVRALAALPVDIVSQLPLLVAPLGYLLGAMPVVAVAHQYGLGRALPGLALVVLTRYASAALDTDRLLPGVSPDGWALAAGSIYMLALALQRAEPGAPAEVDLFSDNIRHLRRGLPYLILVGAIAAAAAQQGWLAGEPATTLLVGVDRLGDAALVGIFAAVGFAPQVVGSSVVSGAHATQGYPEWVLSAGYLSPSPAAAGLAGGAMLASEILGVPRWLRLLGRHPDLRELGASVRESLNAVTELASLIGGFLAAQAILPGYGALLIGGVHLLNEATGRRVMRVAVGPMGALAAGLIANVVAVV